MTNQPPPPPPGNPPPAPPPPGQYGSPGGGYPAPRSGFDPKTVNPLDWAILGLGLLIFIFSFFDYYKASAGPVLASSGAWHASGGAIVTWFGVFFSVLGALVLAGALFAPQMRLPVEARLASLGLFALGSLFIILGIFIHPKFFDVGGVSFGHGFSFWFSLVMILAATVLSLMRAQQVGTKLPGALGQLPDIGHYGSQAGHGGPQSPGGYGTPPPMPPQPGGYGAPPPAGGYGAPPQVPPQPGGYGTPPAPPPPGGYGGPPTP